VAVEVRPRITGELVWVVDKEGATVKKGDLLAEIDSRAARLNVEAAKARLRVAETKVRAAQIKTANAKRLMENKLVSQEELELSLVVQAEAEAAFQVAKVEVEQAELNLSMTRVTAPIDGQVSRIEATEGSLVTANQTRILTLIATDPLHVVFNVPEAVLLQLRREGKAAPDKLTVAVGFSGEEGHPHEAKLDHIGTEINLNTGSARFQATLPNPKGLFSPGMSARVQLTTAAK
jgi:RND family efflux transporter MFP subunit